MTSSGSRYPGDVLGITHVHPARFYDFLLSGKDNFRPDREAAREVLIRRPQAAASARHNRAFHDRAVLWLAMNQNVSQFLDIGAGLPCSPDTHEIAQSVWSDARIAYVDCDHSKSGCVHCSRKRLERSRFKIIDREPMSA